MNSLSKLIWTALVCLLLAACATGGLKYAEVSASARTLSPEEGRLYVYRLPNAGFGSGVQPDVKLNGSVIGSAQPNGFFFVDRKPGTYEITTTTEVEQKLSLTLESGQTRFVRLGISFGFFVAHVYPELVDNDVGEKEIRELRYIGR